MIRIAIPNKGRIYPEIVRLLEKIGLEVPENGRKLYVNTSNPNIQLVYARAADIPRYVAAGAADLGITGEDMLRESGGLPEQDAAGAGKRDAKLARGSAKVEKLLALRMGQCQIAVAAREDSTVKGPADYRAGMRVATKLETIAREYFAQKKLECEIVRFAGALELAPSLGVADLIVDQVSTGTTLAANNLRVVEVIMDSEVFLVANSESRKTKEVEIDEVKLALESVITAESRRYVMANVPSQEALDRIVGTMPSMESPTVLPLAKKGEFAVHTVVESAELIATIRLLKLAGAKDILVMNMSRLVE